MKYQVVIFLLTVLIAHSQAKNIDECLRKDSISCIQRNLFRRVREFLNKDNLDIFTGVSLVKNKDFDEGSRSGKELIYEQEIENADNVVKRQSAIEKFLREEVSDFFSGRSLKINFMPIFDKIGESARAATESIPIEIRQAANEVVEGRGKKKLLKTIIPLLIAAKLKIGLLATLAYFSVALLANKAIFVSVISIAISAFLGLKAIWISKHQAHEAAAYNAGAITSGWSPPVSTSGWSSGGSAWEDPHSSYSAQSQAYSGYHR